MKVSLLLFAMFLGISHFPIQAFARYCENGSEAPLGCYCTGENKFHCPNRQNGRNFFQMTDGEIILAGASPCYVWINHCRAAQARDPYGKSARYWCDLAKNCGSSD